MYKKLHFSVLVDLNNQRRYTIAVLGKTCLGIKVFVVITSYVHSDTYPVILYCLHLSSFRTPEKESISKAVLQKSRGRSQLWAHSKEPLKQPLLKKACTDPDLRDLACQAFIDILLFFSLGPKDTQGKSELAPSAELTSIQIIPHPYYRGYVDIKVGSISSAWLSSVSLVYRQKVLLPPNAPELLMAQLTENVALGGSEIYCIFPEQTTNTTQITAKQWLLHRERGQGTSREYVPEPPPSICHLDINRVTNMLRCRWDFPFAFPSCPPFVLNSAFTHHEIHGGLSLKTGTLLCGSHWPDICSSHPGGGPAGWDLLSDYEATDWEQKQVLTRVQTPSLCRAWAQIQVVSRDPCYTCDRVGAEGKDGPMLQWPLPFCLVPGRAVGLTLAEHWGAVTGRDRSQSGTVTWLPWAAALLPSAVSARL